MSGRSEPADGPAWRQLLNLGNQLLCQTSLATQRETVINAAVQLTGGRADLWLSETLERLADTDDLTPFASEPPTDLMRQSFRARRTLASPDAEPDGPLSVAAPLLAQDTVLGVLSVERPDGPPFASDEIELIDGLAIQSAVALHAARRLAIERWRVEQLSLVRQVSAQITRLLDLDELARQVTSLVLSTFDYYWVALFTFDRDDQILHCAASAKGSSSDPDSAGTSPMPDVRVGEGIVGQVGQSGIEILANDVSQESHYRSIDALPETNSEVALPLKIRDRVLGVLDVQSNQLNAFDDTDLLVLRALADQIAIAVEDTRLYSGLRKRAEQLAAVADVSRAVSSILDLDILFNEVVSLIHNQFDYSFVYLFTVDDVRQQMVFRAGSTPPDEELQSMDLICSLDDSEGLAAWSACHGETVLVSDTSTDPRFKPLKLPPIETASELAVPLSFGDEVLGVLDVQSDRKDAFSKDDQLLFEALADNVAIAIRNANLYRSERWRRQVADSLREVAGLLSANVDLEQVLDAILTELERNLPCKVATIWLLRDDRLCLGAAHGIATESSIGELPSEAAPWLHQALQADKPIIRTANSPHDPVGESLGYPSDYSAIAAPLRAGDRRLGVLTLAHSSAGRYGAESRAMTAAFASYAAVAIENTRLYQETQEQASISTIMLQVSKATQSLTTLDQVLETVVDLIPMLVGVDRCAILLWDEDEQTFSPATAYGLNTEQQDSFGRWYIAPGDEPAFDDLRLTKSPIFVYDVATDSRLSGATAWALGFESLLILPLLAQGEILGTMVIDYQEEWLGRRSVGALRDERLAIIQGITNQTAAAIENTQLRESQREEAYVSAALLQVAQAVASLNELDDILQAIVRIAPLLVGVEWCVIFLWDDTDSIFRVAQTYGISRTREDESLEPLHDLLYSPGGFPLLDAVRENDSTLVHALESLTGADYGEEAPVPLEFVSRLPQDQPDGLRSLMAVPLSVKGDVLGVMLLEEAMAPRRSLERWTEIVTGIAHQTALAIQSDLLQQEMAGRERLERELQLAREIQQTLMPRELPDLPDWEMAVLCLPARQVGGDFYDFFELPDGRMGLVIADVADKGMPAAFFHLFLYKIGLSFSPGL